MWQKRNEFAETGNQLRSHDCNNSSMSTGENRGGEGGSKVHIITVSSLVEMKEASTVSSLAVFNIRLVITNYPYFIIYTSC